MSTTEVSPSTTTHAPPALRTHDFLDPDMSLSDEERLIRDTVRQFVRRDVTPGLDDALARFDDLSDPEPTRREVSTPPLGSSGQRPRLARPRGASPETLAGDEVDEVGRVSAAVGEWSA